MPSRSFVLLVVAGTVVVVATVVGLVVDFRSFVVNILAGVVSVIISFVVALEIVDRYIQHQRQQQWARVQVFTLRAIAVHLCEVVGGLFMHYPGLSPWFRAWRSLSASVATAGPRRCGNRLDGTPERRLVGKFPRETGVRDSFQKPRFVGNCGSIGGGEGLGGRDLARLARSQSCEQRHGGSTDPSIRC